MTIKEIYEWAKRNGVEDYEAVVKYRDGGGEYYGEDTETYSCIDEKEKRVILGQSENFTKKQRKKDSLMFPLRLKIKTVT